MIENIETDPSGRASCGRCNKHIPKGTLRGTESYPIYNGKSGIKYYCKSCSIEKIEQDIEDFKDNLRELKENK